ncbi:hypothetical protein DV736_g2924, partial [Chaetothyriales sp. CBS 134916]
MAKWSNPLGFSRGPVTVIASTVFLAIAIVLIIIQSGVPSPPTSATPVHGVNLTEAWLDLQLLTASYHPYNSYNNDYVHDWLLLRVEAILAANEASAPAAVVFDDRTSNLSFSSRSVASSSGLSVYFEGTNIITYIRGSEDDQTAWWQDSRASPSAANSVLVNAHYDSVSSGFGATDDGIGVVTILQLIKYYTTPGNQPKHGIVLLLNNGEEDYLNGANVFTQHPTAKVVSSFLNLEGAGAGGRAALFRSTDAEVTRAYAKSPYPFGSVLSSDAFNRGLIRSQTDYVVFNGVLGLRGLDVAFMEPRARYHTNQDDTQHTSKASLWHMLSAAIATTRELTSHPVQAKPSSELPQAIWFDLFGRIFVIFDTHTFFALSVTLLVVGPVVLLLTALLLYHFDKFYLFASSRKYHMSEGDEIVSLYGWRGFFRFPLISVFACAGPVALAFLLFKENEFVIHGSEWTVWAVNISSFIFIAWFLSRTADYTRPSSLTRVYGLTWIWTAWWAFLVVAVVAEEQGHVSGVYFVLIYTACVFVATWFSYLELFSLRKKSQYSLEKLGAEAVSSSRSLSRARNNLGASAEAEPEEDNDIVQEGGEPTETTGLLASRGRSAYKKYSQHDNQEDTTPSDEHDHDTNEEPDWSKKQWGWLWIFQFISLVPVTLVVVGQIALLTVAGLHQTGADGSSLFLVYIDIAILTIVLFSPLVPFIHRFTWHVPIFLLLVLISTLIYNLTAFPFSASNRLKLFFLQQVDLDHGNNTVSLIGANDYVQLAISQLPSATGQQINCAHYEASSERQKCSWAGILPNVVQPVTDSPSPEVRPDDWTSFNITKLTNHSDTTIARFTVSGRDTRACRILFDHSIRDFKVIGQAPIDPRLPPVPFDGSSNEIRLWSRTWNRVWTVDVKWDTPAERAVPATNSSDRNILTGKVVCLWSDVNQRGIIPAYDEALHYVPEWVAISKAADGLVEGYKRFSI